MSSFFTLWRKELSAYFLSPIAYVMIMFFLIIMGFSFWLLVGVLQQGMVGATIMNELFGSIFFWISLLVVVPLQTMRLFAEEKRSGTMETLMTSPVTDAEVVLAKFAGAMTFFVILWLPTVTYTFVLRFFETAGAPIDLGPMMSGYLGAFLVGAFYLSVGLFCSSLTRSQIVAAMITFAVINVFFFSGLIAYVVPDGPVRDFGTYISAVEHMRDFARGMVDSRPVVLYLTACLFMLFATVKVVESRKWK